MSRPPKYILCSECFTSVGLKLDADAIGYDDARKCLNCTKVNGKKLTRDLLERLASRYFVRGSRFRPGFGEFPQIQFNQMQVGKTDVAFPTWLKRDVKLLENTLKIGFFYYGPRFWMFGDIEPLKRLQNQKSRLSEIERIFKQYPAHEMSKGDSFFRIRVNPNDPLQSGQFDSAPYRFLGKNRLDSKNLPVLYASQDLQACIHECRVTIEDEIYLAALQTTKRLRLLDLTPILEEDGPEWESLDLSVQMLFSASKHVYPITRKIASAANEKGYDGVIYPSYFTAIRNGIVPFDTVLGISIRQFPKFKHLIQSSTVKNFAFFGRPVKSGVFKVKNIERIVLNKITYDFSFGPVLKKEN